MLCFDVDTFLPDGAFVNSASLNLRLSFSSLTDDVPIGTVRRRPASPWSEFGVTWDSEPTWTPVDSTADVGVRRIGMNGMHTIVDFGQLTAVSPPAISFSWAAFIGQR